MYAVRSAQRCSDMLICDVLVAVAEDDIPLLLRVLKSFHLCARQRPDVVDAVDFGGDFAQHEVKGSESVIQSVHGCISPQ